MPKMNGIEACRELRRHPETALIPVIMVTTRSEMDYVESAFVHGCTDYVTKPVSAVELMAKVRSYLPADTTDVESELPPASLTRTEA